MTETTAQEAEYRVLIVDDAPEDRQTYLRFLERSRSHTYLAVEADSLAEAWSSYSASPPNCILLDYNLPDGDGLELLKRLTDEHGEVSVPVVILTGQGSEEVAVSAMKEGALDYVVKGRMTAEALCRTVHKAIEKAGLVRTIRRQQEEKDTLIAELREALEQVKTLRGIIPICASCKQIRDDKGYWQQVEEYVSSHSEAQFTHGICPECIEKLYPSVSRKVLGDTKPEAPAP